MSSDECSEPLKTSSFDAMRKRRRRISSFHALLTLYVVLQIFGAIKNVEARAQITKSHGIQSIERGSKNVSTKELVGKQSIRDARDTNEKATTITPTKRVHPKSSDIASKAATEAKAANDAQIMAGRQAAHQVKVQLANKAAQSAKAAQAALSGKVALLEQLEDESRETQTVFKEGTLELERVRENTEAALKVVNFGRQQLQMLMRVVETAKSSLESAELSSEGAKRTFAKKQRLLDAAKQRVSELKNRLDLALAELAKTREFATKAEVSAREARAKVSRVDLPLLDMSS